MKRHYPVRRKRESEVKVHVPDHVTCQGFAWYGAKMWNELPAETREMKNHDSFKVAVKRYIWENIPSYLSMIINDDDDYNHLNNSNGNQKASLALRTSFFNQWERDRG